MFCKYFQINPIPTTVQVLCFYAQFLSRSFKSVNSIKNYLSGVKLLHLYLDDDYPKFDEFQLKLTLKGLARMNPHKAGFTHNTTNFVKNIRIIRYFKAL